MKVSLRGLPEKTVYTGPWAKDHNSSPLLTWAAPDGRTFFVLAGGELGRWALCGASLNSAIILRRIKAFAFSSDRLYWISVDTPQKLHWKSWKQSEEGQLDMPLPYRYVAVVSDDQLILYDSDQANDTWKTHFTLLDLKDGRYSPLTFPVEGKVFDVVPMKQSPMIVVEAWRGGNERLDGTELTEFLVWDYKLNRTFRSTANEKMYQLHVKSENIFLPPSSCN